MKNNIHLNKVNALVLLLVVFLFLAFGSLGACAESAFPAAIIQLPENENAILVEKKTQTLFLYTADSKNLFLRLQVPCSTGEANGIKQKAGDKKTPEGVYFLNDEFEDKYLSPIYGKKAFPTDYPNFMDKKTGKNGSAIWIHGTNKKLKPYDSNGCIALENSNILRLSEYVTLDTTPVVLAENIDKVDKKILVRREKDINYMLKQWTKAIETGSYHDYLSFYSDKYLPLITWWEQWLEIRNQADKASMPLKVRQDRTGIYYHNNIFVVLFDYSLVGKNEALLLGKRKLFLEYQDHNYKIVGDIYQTIAKSFQDAKAPLVVAAATLVKPVLKRESVLDTINQWMAAWSAKNMDKYAEFYASNFYSDGMNKKKWVKRKRNIAKKYSFINVTGQEFKIKYGQKKCEVTFFQEYESSGFTTQGTKRLKLVNKGGSWKIYQESWKEK